MRILTTFIILCTLVYTACADEHSYYDLGIAAYERGHYQAALYDFETRAVKGDTIAQFCLGFMYQHGKSVAAENKKAMEWYERAASQGYAPAQNDLGVMYVRASESAKNPKTLETAVKWFEKAAKQNNLPAQHNLGIIAISVQDRLKWWTQAASQEYAPSQRELGNLYYRGQDIDQNFTEAVKWYSKAANREDPDPVAQHNLGLCYELGHGVKKDLKAAFRYYEKSAKQDCMTGKFKLAYAYMLGKGTDENSKEAFRWYKEAAQESSINAQNNLAAMYGRGEVIPKESEIAKKMANEMAYRWYFQAAQQGNSVAQANIAVGFENDQDQLSQDFTEAYYWYSSALKDENALNDTPDKDLVSKTIEARERIGNLLTEEQKSQIQELIDDWQPRVLNGSGTGFYIDKHYILTNSHVVTWKDPEDEDQEYDEYRIPYRRVELIAWEPELDLALLYDKSENKDVVTAVFRSEHVKKREKITIFGYPQSRKLFYDGHFTNGVVSALSDTITLHNPHNRFRHTAPTQRGNSGGPVFDGAGNVVGVSVSMLLDFDHFFVRAIGMGVDTPQTINLAQNINFAIKFDVIKDFLDFVKEDKNTLDFLKKNEFLHLDYKSTEISGKDISHEEIRSPVEKMVIPILCYKNKGKQPLDLIEIGIDKLNR